MPPDASQISLFLKQAREAADLTQHDAPAKAGVHYGVVTSAEQGRDPRTTNFLALVMAYGAEDALARQIKEWRKGTQLRKEPAKPLPTSALRALTRAKDSDEEKGRAR